MKQLGPFQVKDESRLFSKKIIGRDWDKLANEYEVLVYKIGHTPEQFGYPAGSYVFYTSTGHKHLSAHEIEHTRTLFITTIGNVELKPRGV